MQDQPLLRVDKHQQELLQFSRLTIIYSDVTQNYGLVSRSKGYQLIQKNMNNPNVASYDIIAVTPTNEKAFQAACQTLEVDLISLELSDRLDFYIKAPSINVALQRGIFFEINYSPAIRDVAKRRNLIQNAEALIRITKGKNVIISSQALNAMEIRSPYDVMNLAHLFGLSQNQAKICLAENTRSLLFKAATRRHVTKAAVSIVPKDKDDDKMAIDPTPDVQKKRAIETTAEKLISQGATKVNPFKKAKAS